MELEMLDLSGCSSNEEVSEKIQSRVRSISIDKLIEALSSKSVYHEEATRKIYAALATGNNVLLFGPGGFGKSVLVKRICKVLGLPIVFKIGYSGMTAEELLGVPNMSALLNENKYETAFENSVFSKPGILVLEEFFDCDPATAAALKDVLTEKGFREGDSRKESLISSVIITGNKTPDDVSIDDSTAAFYLERFPYRHKMIWKSFTESDYLKFFGVFYEDTKYKENFNKLLLVSKLCAGTDTRISPRVASQAGDCAITLGVDFLDTIEALDTSMISEMKDQVERDARKITESSFLDKIQIKTIEIIDILRTAKLRDVLQHRHMLNELNDLTMNMEISDDMISKMTEVKTLIKHGLHSVESTLLEEVDPESVHEEINNLIYGE